MLVRVSASDALAAVLAATLLAAGPAEAQDAAAPTLSATTLRTYAAPDADQGVAVDGQYFYAIDNYVIAKHRRDTGALVTRWDGGAAGPMQHINSCKTHRARLVCANSNYSALPMGSSVEWFDRKTLRHSATHSLGLRDEGSLVWAVPSGKGWLTGFAHYDRADGRGGTGYKDSRYGNIVTFDAEWRRTGGWLLPDSIQARMKPHSASGGDIGPDGLLYLSGHDRPEIYAMARPVAGPYLVHVATIALEANGQAFSFIAGEGRTIMAVDRTVRQVRIIALPLVPVPDNARIF